MGLATKTVLVLLAAGGSAAALGPAAQASAAERNSPPAEGREPSSPAPSPTPTPRYRLLPYAFEAPQTRSTAPLLRFEDRTEVRSLEMNEAIARFFDRDDDKGSMLRGATPGGAPTLREMASYRPHVTQGVNLLGVAAIAAQELKRHMKRRKGMPPLDPSPSPTPPGSLR